MPAHGLDARPLFASHGAWVQGSVHVLTQETKIRDVNLYFRWGMKFSQTKEPDVRYYSPFQLSCVQ